MRNDRPAPGWLRALSKPERDELDYLFAHTQGDGYWHPSEPCARKRELLEGGGWLTIARWIEYSRWRYDGYSAGCFSLKDLRRPA